MKKIFISISALFVVGLSHAQTTNTENYVQTRVYLEPVTTSSSTAKQIETVQYFDGLGRPKQVVNIKASPLEKDVVTHIEYDGFGRQVKDYLPVPQSGTANGAIVTSPLANATQTDIYGSEKIYAEKILENSPLDRIQQQIQVGNDWTSKPVKLDYDANIAGEVKKYIATFNYSTFTSDIVLSSTGYAANQLYKTTVSDEDGNKTIEFKNGQGQTILVRKMLDGTNSADTYYVYNDYNQLAYVMPPLAAAANAVDAATLNNLCYQYKYDGRNRLVEKKLPGKGWEQMIYNKRDQVIYYRDTNLKNGITGFIQNEAWVFTKYDKFGRIVYTGICRDGNSRQNIQQSVDLQTVDYESRAGGFTMHGMHIEYGNVSYPTSLEKILSVNYYDTYPTGTPAIPTQVLGQNVLTQDSQNSNISTKSLPTASYLKNIEDDNWTKNYTWYDQKGRPIGNHSINHFGGYTKTESLLDFSGTPQQAITKHKRLDSDTERVITENFTYDHQNRLKTHTHQVDNNPVEYLAQNEYNPLSQLKNKKVGGTSLGSGLQSVDYTYNIRGWMTKINNPNDLSGGDFFGYEIKYTNPENTSLSTGRFNGNIAEIDWKTATNPNDSKRRYSYIYDGLNRLQQGIYTEPGSSLVNNNHYNEYLTYDINGNITTLKRFSKPYSGTTAEKIDDLIYNYTGNRLDKITLPTGETNNFSGYNAGQNIISYDTNGNMTNHKDKNISNIEYNYLNLPTFVNAVVGGGWFPGLGQEGQTHTYKYRSDGIKYYTRVDDISPYMQQYSINEYLEGFQYQQRYTKMSTAEDPYDTGLVLKFYPTSEGYFDFEKNKYIYNYTDHLGNIRLSYLYNGIGVEVLDENNYYPFGLRHSGYNILSGNYGYNYKYNGKELQETGMYDYGARFYMPDIGRWGVIDPRSQYTHEAYSYVWNNPISFWDPTGMEGEDPDPKKIYGPKGGALIQEVVLTGSRGPVKSNMAGLSFTHQAFIPAIPYAIYAAGEAIFLAISAYAAADIADKTYDAVRNRDLSSEEANEETSSATPDVFPETEDDTDVNGVVVPDDSGIETQDDMSIPDPFNKKGGGKNGQHANQKAKQSAAEKYEQAKSELNNLRSKPNKTPQDKANLKKLEGQVKQLQQKKDFTGENHSRNAKGSRR